MKNVIKAHLESWVSTSFAGTIVRWKMSSDKIKLVDVEEVVAQ